MAKVKLIGKTHVQPAKKLGRKECQLVTFDLPYLAFFYNQKLLLYRGGDFSAMAEKLRRGLGTALESYYQLAGRLGRYEDGTFMVEYDDGMDGVEVSEAVAGDVRIADLVADDCPLSSGDLVPYGGVLNIEGLHRPLLSVQLTNLRDGLAIGCAFNHAILDGTSTWQFMHAWAFTCCNEGKPAPAPPFLDRTMARSTRTKLEIPAAENGGAAPEPQLRERVFRFSEAAIEAIKSEVNSGKGKPFTTFQCLSSHVWRAITRARRLRPEEPTVFTVFADCRRRMEPPMPDNYFGNLIQAVFAGAAAGAVAGGPAEGAAAAIRSAVEMHGAAAIEKRNREWEANPVMLQYKDAGKNCVAVGSSPRFDVYGVDFGWGPPASVRSGSNNRFDGMVYLYQGAAGRRSVDVEISLEAAAMGRLEGDADFLRPDVPAGV